MIFGYQKELHHYKSPYADLNQVFAWIAHNDALPYQGSTEIIKDIKLNRFSYQGQDINELVYEAHRKQIDVHLVLSGKEKIAFGDITVLQLKQEYQEDGDFALYEGEMEGIITLQAGMFAIFFPEDAHMPKIKIDDHLVDKAVFKVFLK